MDTAEIRQIVRRYIEAVWNRGDVSALDKITTPAFAYHLGGQPARDRAAFAEFIRGTRAAFPDWHVELLDLIVEGTRVAVRWSAQGTHTGPFRAIPPTGLAIAVSGINIYEVSEGRIAAEWEQMDSLGMLQQLGVVPM